MDDTTLAAKIKQAAYMEGDFVLRSGRRSKYYLDKYLFETDPEILDPLGQMLSDRINAAVDRLAGAELGGVPLAAITSIKAGKPYIIVRGSQKAYGTAKRIEGRIEPGDTVVLVEDVVTTGGQSIEAAQVLKASGAEISKILAVIDRQEGGRENIEAAGFSFEALFTRADLDL